jgi:hypothetical protein
VIQHQLRNLKSKKKVLKGKHFIPVKNPNQLNLSIELPNPFKQQTKTPKPTVDVRASFEGKNIESQAKLHNSPSESIIRELESQL